MKYPLRQWHQNTHTAIPSFCTGYRKCGFTRFVHMLGKNNVGRGRGACYQGSSYARGALPPNTFAGKKRIIFYFVVAFFYSFFLRNNFVIMKRAILFLFFRGDTLAYSPNPLCSLKVATLVSTIPHIR